MASRFASALLAPQVLRGRSVAGLVGYCTLALRRGGFLPGRLVILRRGGGGAAV